MGAVAWYMLIQKYEVIYRYFVEYLIETSFRRHTVSSHYAILYSNLITKYYSFYQKYRGIIEKLTKRFIKFLK